MRIKRILKNSTKLRYLERRNHEDVDLSQSFDPDTISQRSCARWMNARYLICG
jgi:hypothetical protein